MKLRHTKLATRDLDNLAHFRTTALSLSELSRVGEERHLHPDCGVDLPITIGHKAKSGRRANSFHSFGSQFDGIKRVLKRI